MTMSRAQLKPDEFNFKDCIRPCGRTRGAISIVWWNALFCDFIRLTHLMSFKFDVHMIHRQRYSYFPVYIATVFVYFDICLSSAL